MLPFIAVRQLISTLGNPAPDADVETLSDQAHYLRTHPVPRLPLALRLLPAPLRRAAQDRARDRHLITLWETAPHLLEDAGYVPVRHPNLPDHLVPAPARVLAHIAARAPEAIAAAEVRFPPAPVPASLVLSAGAARAIKVAPTPGA